MKAGRFFSIRRQGGAGGITGRFQAIAAAAVAVGFFAGTPAEAQNAPDPTMTRVPTATSNLSRSEAERQQAIARARELREAKERASLAAAQQQRIVTRKQMEGMSNLERNIKVSTQPRPRTTTTSTAASTPKPAPAPAVAPEKKKERRGFAGLFGGKKDREEKKPETVVADRAEVEPIAPPPVPSAETGAPAQTLDRIPPPMPIGAEEPGALDPYAGPGEIASVPGTPSGPATAPAPLANPVVVAQPPVKEEDRGLFGGLFSKKKTNDAALRSATMASGEQEEKKGFLGRLFGREDERPIQPAPIPPPAIPPPAMPTEQGSVADPTLLTQNAGQAPAANLNSDPNPQTANLPEISGRTSLVVSPDGAVTNPAAVPAPAAAVAPNGAPQPVATATATVPPPAPAPVETNTGGAHFVVVQHEAGAQMTDAAGAAMQPLPFGTIMQMRKTFGNQALVRLTSGLEGYVELARLRDASFDEATRYYTSGGTLAQ